MCSPTGSPFKSLVDAEAGPINSMRTSVPLKGGDKNQQQERLEKLNSVIKKIDNKTLDLDVECKVKLTQLARLFLEIQVRDCRKNKEVLGSFPKGMSLPNHPPPLQCNPASMSLPNQPPPLQCNPLSMKGQPWTESGQIFDIGGRHQGGFPKPESKNKFDRDQDGNTQDQRA